MRFGLFCPSMAGANKRTIKSNTHFIYASTSFSVTGSERNPNACRDQLALNRKASSPCFRIGDRLPKCLKTRTPETLVEPLRFPPGHNDHLCWNTHLVVRKVFSER